VCHKKLYFFVALQVELGDSLGWKWNRQGNRSCLRRGGGRGEEQRGYRNREMKDLALAGEDCVRVLGPGPEVRAYEEG
jgi:hypothetical protein